MRYGKKTPRIPVKFVNADTDEIMFELHDRNWMNIGELFNDAAISSIMTTEWKNKEIPENVIIIAVGEFQLKAK